MLLRYIALCSYMVTHVLCISVLFRPSKVMKRCVKLVLNLLCTHFIFNCKYIYCLCFLFLFCVGLCRYVNGVVYMEC